VPSIERTLRVDKPLAAVWRYLSDFSTTTEWDPGTVRTTLTSGAGGVGTVYANTSTFLGRETDVTYTVVEREPERMIRLRGVNDSVTATDTITFTGDERATTVHYRAEFALSGLARLAAPIMPIALRKLGDEAEQGMRTALQRL
jgi:carbon monoxide dehydrogenase subunit G